MKKPTVAFALFVCLITPTVFTQTVEQAIRSERANRFSSWLEMVKDAESAYKKKNGHYGDLAALRGAHLLRNLVFESGSSARARSKAEANFVPKSASFQVTVSADRQHFTAVIGDTCMSIMANDSGTTMETLNCTHRDIQDSLEGLIFISYCPLDESREYPFVSQG